jgi:hypothetical protein
MVRHSWSPLTESVKLCRQEMITYGTTWIVVLPLLFLLVAQLVLAIGTMPPKGTPFCHASETAHATSHCNEISSQSVGLSEGTRCVVNGPVPTDSLEKRREQTRFDTETSRDDDEEKAGLEASSG